MSAAHPDPGTSALRDPLVGRLGLSAISLIVSNATVLILFLRFDLSLIQFVLVYWCECIWIGDERREADCRVCHRRFLRK